MIASLVILLLVVLGFLWWWIVQPHGRDAVDRDAQLPLFSARTPGSTLRVVGVGARRVRRDAASPSRPAAAEPLPMPPQAYAANGNGTGAGNGAGAVAESPRSAPPAPPPPARQPADYAPRPVAPPGPAAAPMAAAADATDLEAEKWARPLQPVPANGTVEFLPGRLEVLQGRGVAGQEVRFVRPTRPGERPVVTFGRGEGPLYRHVQLNVSTVSRLHARLSHYADTGGWAVENLSSTNPTVLNGEELAAGAAPRPLRDGDRLEMGEVVFTYHAR